jgi:alcohol dehydrogenase class IV
VRLQTLARVAELMGLDVAGNTAEDAAEAAINKVRTLRHEIGIPDRLRQIGVREEQLSGFAQAASGIQRMLRVNPRPATASDLEAILRAAY